MICNYIFYICALTYLLLFLFIYLSVSIQTRIPRKSLADFSYLVHNVHFQMHIFLIFLSISLSNLPPAPPLSLSLSLSLSHIGSKIAFAFDTSSSDGNHRLPSPIKIFLIHSILWYNTLFPKYIFIGDFNITSLNFDSRLKISGIKGYK